MPIRRRLRKRAPICVEVHHCPTKLQLLNPRLRSPSHLCPRSQCRVDWTNCRRGYGARAADARLARPDTGCLSPTSNYVKTETRAIGTRFSKQYAPSNRDKSRGRTRFVLYPSPFVSNYALRNWASRPLFPGHLSEVRAPLFLRSRNNRRRNLSPKSYSVWNAVFRELLNIEQDIEQSFREVKKNLYFYSFPL